ncbi:FAD-binding oxidoreductase [Albibacterium bauzanense]|uniref:Ferredoxin-NADP reductase n=1 Tax=Albibacterium bauzanense TaxID=653929 RepID=A0A4R1LPF0_9SPHI|nr:FAD-binding oxidoreductase [Albibacterium bauzanense]TCK80612.1 ferredoxin-NADP reductase [Albibacterium bauzanense]
MEQIKIISIENDTHNVVHIKTKKPQDVSFVPGQAVDVSVNKPGFEEELRPFTFTSLPSDNHLEFFIKTYPERNGVTKQIGKLKQGDSLSIGEVFGDIQYKGEGIFIAGGAGVTPFISIFRSLEKQHSVGKNKLIFANKTSNDIINQAFFNRLLGENFINVLSEEEMAGFEHGYITKDLIKAQMESSDTYFYLCGPPPMMDAVLIFLQELGIDDTHIVKEQF